METRKTSGRTPNEKQSVHFLMGLIVGLALLLAALEYTSGGGKTAEGVPPEDLEQDLELLPVADQRNMTAAVRTASESKPSEIIKAADRPAEALPPEERASNVDIPFDREAETKTELPPDPTRQTMVSPAADRPVSFRVVEELPEFPGGMSEFVQWLTRQLVYPPLAKQQRIQGKVVVGFIVNKDGSIAGLKVVKPVFSDLDTEAMRVMRQMPKWKPGKMKGQVCRTMVHVPIVFKL